MFEKYYGEYNIYLENNNVSNIINIKNSTTELLQNYINYGAYYPSVQQVKYYEKNNFFLMTENANSSTENYVKNLGKLLYTSIKQYNRINNLNYIFLYNCTEELNIYEESKKGELGRVTPICEFADIVTINDAIIDTNNNKLTLKFRSSTNIINSMNINKIVLFSKTGINKVPNPNYNIYRASNIDAGSAQISEANLEIPISITEDTNFFIEYIFTFDYSDLMKFPTGTFNYKYYENGQLLEKQNEYLIKPNLILQIENIISQCDYIETLFYKRLDVVAGWKEYTNGQESYMYTSAEITEIKNKFKDIYWGNGIYKNIYKFYNENKAISKEVNLNLIPKRLQTNTSDDYFTNHGFYFYIVKLDNYSNKKYTYASQKKYQYAKQKYILSDLNLIEKAKLIQPNMQQGINIFKIPSFQLKNDIDFINKTSEVKMLSLNSISKTDDTNGSTETFLEIDYDNDDYNINNLIYTYFSDINYRSYNDHDREIGKSHTSYVYKIFDKDSYLKSIKNNLAHDIIFARNEYRTLNLTPGIFAFSQFNYEYTIFLKNPIPDTVDLTYFLNPNLKFGLK